MQSLLDSFQEHHRTFLQQHAFDDILFAQFSQQLRAGHFPIERNQLNASLQAPTLADITPWPSQAQAQEWARIGAEALQQGKVAAVVLNGGMATRFGGGVKGIVPVLNDRSFLNLKLADLQTYAVPVFLLNSFATHAATLEHLHAHNLFKIPEHLLHTVQQGIGVRLTPQGECVYSPEGHPSFYAPGHGDVLYALHRSEAFQRFVSNGGLMVTVSNVDNLGATLSPTIIGAHITSQADVTVEVASRAPGDKGGAPAWVNGRLEIVEGFRFPPHFNIETIPVFNTNTFVLNTSAIHTNHPLTWYRADKEVHGQQVVQFERLLGEITSFTRTHYLHVPREGLENRFLPVKTIDDLADIQPVLHNRFKRILSP